MKRIISLFVALLLILSLCMPVFATSESDTQTTSDTNNPLVDYFDSLVDAEFVKDGAYLLSDSEINELNEHCAKLKKQYGTSVYVITTNTTNGKDINSYSESLYYDKEIDDKSICLVIDMGNRKVDVYATPDAMGEFNDVVREDIYKSLWDELTNNNFAKAAQLFVNGVEHYLDPTTDKEDYLYKEPSKEPKKAIDGKWIVISLIAGFFISLMISLSLKKQLNTVSFQRGAASYVKDGSMNLTNSTDAFLYATVTKTEKPKDNGGKFGGMSSSSGSGGGHTSGSF